ncbi:amidohydrolase [Amnibacterium setariae]|uniref:amidohydrolase n=1 Tax=Amnibacterium setariae TaxID=2306585 RepID=UPI001F2A9232|nr:amidohydrolase family protein [Amnibacterium setariae]
MTELLLRRARVDGAVLDVHVRDGRIAALAPDLDAGAAPTLDLDGRVLLRGLWDEHVHVTQAALAAQWIALGGAPTAADALGRVEAALPVLLAAWPDPEVPIVGIGFQDGLWPDGPTREAIDRVGGDRALVLISHDVHAVWLNTLAARRFGVEPGPDGILREEPAFAVGREVNALASGRSAEAVAQLLDAAVRRGVVGVVDLEMTWNLDPWLARVADGWTGPRIEAGVYPPDLELAAGLGFRTGTVLGADGLLTVGPLKTLIDGALNTRTAFCAHPYPDGGRGLLTVPEAELLDLLRRAKETGFVPAVHAIGDAAVSVALDAFAAARLGGRMEHAQLVAEADLPRFAALGVTASVQPAHLLDDREVAAEHWPGRTGRAYPFRALLDAGATLAFGSDAPVAPLDPWRAIRAAVDRALPGEPVWHPEQRIDLAEALDASARGRAQPRVGDAADLIALDLPVEELDPDAVAMTLVGGRIAHQAL